MSNELQKLAANHLHTRWPLTAFDQAARGNANIAVNDINSDTSYSCKGETLRLSAQAIESPSFQQFNQACQIARKATEIPPGKDIFSELSKS